MKTKKLLSILLALMMMLSVVPMYASAAEALSASNVTQWPTLSYKSADGKMHFGQTLSDGLIINDDEIVLDENGNQVAGHFEFIDPTLIPSPCTDAKSHIQFMPDNTEEYTGFQKKRSSLLYSVETVTPVYVDEVNDPVVATEVEAGTTLSTSILSGGKMTNPYNPEEPEILERTWEWLDPYVVVNESGYYEAIFMPAGYTVTTAQVFVRIAGEIPETTIAEMPAVDTLYYDEVTTWGDVELKGGKAILKIEGTEVAGTFAVTDYWKTRTVNPGSYEIDVVFTPADPEAALPYSLKIPVTVNKGQIKFVDENGNEVVPEITVDYGTEVGDYINLFKGFATNCNETLRFTLADEVKNAVPTVGTHEYEVTAATFKTVGVASNYEDTVLKFKVIVEPMGLAVKFLTETGGNTNPNYCEIGVTSNVLSARPQGTFAIYVDGVLLKDGLKYHEKVEWPVAVSKTYELKVVYTPVDNDPYIIEDYTDTIKKNLYWMFTSGKNVSGPSDLIACGATVEISANLTSENFAGWKVTNAAGEEVDLGLDNTSVKATITMPDYDIHVEALEKNATSGDGDTDLDIDLDLDFDGTHKFDFVNLIQNLIAKLKAFIQQIGDFFSNMSLEGLGNITG